jgi:group II intron reverse transcriptase/maturase
MQQQVLERMYRQLYNPDLYRTAYSKIYANDGALTEGVNEDTLDGTSERKFQRTIDALKSETYRWQPVRRAYIPKKDNKKRPLGIPTGTDKLLQAVIKELLEAYYEPQFSERSHGFRPGRGCHTALRQIAEKHRDVSWFIEGDIKGFFDNVDHDTLLDVLRKRIQDERFIALLKRLLDAGYMEDWKWNRTHSGTPQGGIISPLLANIYLNEFDQWVETTLLPMYNKRGSGNAGRSRNPEYRHYEYLRRKAKIAGDKKAFQKYGRLMKSVPSVIDDDTYRKLEYVRYADDFVLSFAGPKHEAEDIKGLISTFLLTQLHLEMSEEKTLITSARHGKASFLDTTCA